MKLLRETIKRLILETNQQVHTEESFKKAVIPSVMNVLKRLNAREISVEKSWTNWTGDRGFEILFSLKGANKWEQYIADFGEDVIHLHVMIDGMQEYHKPMKLPEEAQDSWNVFEDWLYRELEPLLQSSYDEY
tara:strand:+ start:1065 stop:1463 length:399 start_codon:yes stop_codon:yes gene_type:complete